jgi:hypothetical protein
MERFFYKVSVNHEGLMVEGNPWGTHQQGIWAEDDQHAARLAASLWPAAAGWFWLELTPATCCLECEALQGRHQWEVAA